MFTRLAVVSCAFLTVGAAVSLADTLYLRSGATVQGSFAGGDTRQIKIIVGDHVETYNLEEVTRLEVNGGGGGGRNSVTPTPARGFPDQGAPPDRSPSDRSASDRPTGDRERLDRDRTPAPSPQDSSSNSGVEIPAGTNLVVRMIDSVDSERDNLGKTFRASIDEPVVVNGQTVIPRGADVVAKLIDQKESGKFSGKTSLTLDLMSIMINGRMVDIVTSDVTQASGSRSSRSAKTVGGGAAVGAIFGGIFGGGAGAAIGAASGGALGAGAQVATKGQRVKIPSETRLSFLLQQPLRP